MKSLLRNHGFPLFVILTSVVIAVVFYRILPDTIPVHWGVSGSPDSFAAKSLWSVFDGTIIIVSIYLIFLAIPKIDPRRKNIAEFKQYNLLRDILLVFFLFFEYLTLRSAASPQQKISAFYILFGLGLLLIFIGNYLPKIKSNFFIGIRTPWTLSSEEVWKKTHRIGGRLSVLAGVIIIISGFMPIYFGLVSILVSVAVIVLLPFIYSYFLFKNLEGKQIENKST